MSSDLPVNVAIAGGDASVRRSLGRLLRQAGFKPVTFSSVEEFLADAVRVPYGCLLVNAGLRTMTPADLQQKLLQIGARVPVIYITSHDDPAAKEAAVRSGCAGFFRTTDAAPDIIAAIRRAQHLPKA